MDIEKYRELRKQVRIMEKIQQRLIGRIEELEGFRNRMEASNPAGRATSDLPGSVHDETSLRTFAKALVGNDFNTWLPGEGIRELARKIRDGLISEYPDFSLHPRWTDTDRRHLDAIYWRVEGAIVDFVRASTAAGRLSEKLQWHVYPREES